MPDTKAAQARDDPPDHRGRGACVRVRADRGQDGEDDAPFVWPRDLNAPSSDKPEWGTDPEALRDA